MAKNPLSVKRKTLVVISDSTGETAAKVMEAVIGQFEHRAVELHVAPHVSTSGELEQLMEKAKRDGALVTYTLVNTELRMVAQSYAASHGIPTIDLMSPLLACVSQWLGAQPLNMPGRHHRPDPDYFRRIEAMEFMHRNDDGQQPNNFGNADIILVGVSRSSKTPVSHVLARKGYKVANWPLVLGVPIPDSIEKADSLRVFVLGMDVATLLQIRRARLQHLGQGETAYTDPVEIRREVAWAEQLTVSHPRWTKVSAAGRAVEETEADILKCYTQRFGYPVL
jgi:regulator of PEP synthase PpsR (kinase-PPPase family)